MIHTYDLFFFLIIIMKLCMHVWYFMVWFGQPCCHNDATISMSCLLRLGPHSNNIGGLIPLVVKAFYVIGSCLVIYACLFFNLDYSPKIFSKKILWSSVNNCLAKTKKKDKLNAFLIFFSLILFKKFKFAFENSDPTNPLGKKRHHLLP